MDSKAHWTEVYTGKTPDQVSWYQINPENSLSLTEASRVEKDAPILDVGGGASVLVDRLLEKGFTRISVLDLSGPALEYSKKRLGADARKVRWIEDDITLHTPEPVSLWHDRAVFHFLTQEEDRLKYLQVLNRSLAPGGHLILATFALDGPKRCSGLDTVQYSSESLSETLGSRYQLQEFRTETHRTPWNSEQKFIYCRYMALPGS